MYVGVWGQMVLFIRLKLCLVCMKSVYVGFFSIVFSLCFNLFTFPVSLFVVIVDNT